MLEHVRRLYLVFCPFLRLLRICVALSGITVTVIRIDQRLEVAHLDELAAVLLALY